MSLRIDLPNAADAQLIATALRVTAGAVPAGQTVEERLRCRELADEINAALFLNARREVTR